MAICNLSIPEGLFSSVFRYRVIGVILLSVFYLFFVFLVSRSSLIWSLFLCLIFQIFILAACLFDSSISFLRVSWLLMHFSLFSLVPWLLFLWLLCILCGLFFFFFLCTLWLFHGGGWGCEVSCGGHHRLRGKTTTGSALDEAVFDIAQILAHLVQNMSRSQIYLGFGHFGRLPYFFWSIPFWWAYGWIVFPL